MRMMLVRWSAPFLVAASATGCAPTSAGPTQSTTTTTASGTTQSPSANVRATGSLTFGTCSSDGCAYQGFVTNDGPDCASNVRGVTHLFDASGQEIAMQQWEILGRVRGGQTAYSGCCFSQAAVNAYRTFRTDVSFEALRCI